MPRKKIEQLTLNYEPLSPKHLAFHRAYSVDNIPTRILCGGVGTGKTRAVAADILKTLLTNPLYAGKKALVAGITGTHCRSLLVPEFRKVLTGEDERGRPTGLIEGKHYTVTMFPMPEITLFNGCKIQFVSLESGVNLRGYNSSIVFVDDAGESNGETFDAVCDRAFREKENDSDPDLGYIVCTLNPTNKYHWAYKRYFEPKENGTLDTRYNYVDTLTMFDNPVLKSGWAAKEARYAHSPTEYRRKIMGEWCSFEHNVYSSFSPENHIKPREYLYEPIREGASYMGVDMGGKDATCVLWCAKYNDKFYIYREYYSTESSRPISKHCEFINRQTEHVIKRYSDHYTESINTFREHGVKLTLARKGQGAKLAGLEMINQLFEDNRIYIAEDCKNLIRELQQYEWLQNSARDVPKDGNDHACDALRYMLFEIASASGGPLHVVFSDEVVLINPTPDEERNANIGLRAVGMTSAGVIIYE